MKGSKKKSIVVKSLNYLIKILIFIILKSEKIFFRRFKKDNNNPIIIIGMHRSGTTLLSRLMEQEGVFLGKNNGVNNESLFFQKLNKKILNLSGSTWDNPQNLNYVNKFFNENTIKYLNYRLNSFSAVKYWGLKNFFLKSRITSWGWKDPRNTLTLDYWIKVFPNARIIHIVRNPIDVAISLKNRQEKSEQENNWNTTNFFFAKYFNRRFNMGSSYSCIDINNGIALWKEYISKLDKYDYNIYTIRYEDLLENPGKELSNVFNFIDSNFRFSVKTS